MLASKPPAAATRVEARTLTPAIAPFQRRREEHAIVDFQIEHFGIVENFNAELFGGEIERVQHRPAAAEEERIGPPEAQRAAERGLPAHALFDDPVQNILGLAIMCLASSSSVCPPVTRSRSSQNSCSV